jgi:hypothetical protein
MYWRELGEIASDNSERAARKVTKTHNIASATRHAIADIETFTRAAYLAVTLSKTLKVMQNRLRWKRPYMDSSSFASKLYLAIMARLHTYIRPHKLAFIH